MSFNPEYETYKAFLDNYNTFKPKDKVTLTEDFFSANSYTRLYEYNVDPTTVFTVINVTPNDFTISNARFTLQVNRNEISPL